MSTLENVTEQLQESNLRLDEIDNRFLEFFRQLRADKLDMLEMMREMRSADGEAAPSGAGGQPPASDEKQSGWLKWITLLGGAVAALALNAEGAVGWMKSFGKDLKVKIPEAFKSAGSSIAKFADDVKTRLITKITESTIFKKGVEVAKGVKAKGAEVATRAKSLVNTGAEKLKALGGSTLERARGIGSSALETARSVGSTVSGKFQQIKAGVVSMGETAALKAMYAGDKIKAGAQAIAGTKAGQLAIGAGKTVAKGVNKMLVPLAIGTSAYEGYKMANEDPTLGTAGKIAVGAGGAASSFFGGFADFVKTIALDAPIELLQKAGLASEDGYLQRVQDVSIQRDISDALVREMRDGIRKLAGTEVERKTMQTVAEKSGVTIINNNTNAPTTTQNNVNNNGGGDIQLPPSSMNNSTRSSEYAL